MKKKKIIKGLLWVLLVLIILCGTTWFISWKSPKYYTVSSAFNNITDSIIPFKNYGLVADHVRPYIIRSEQIVVFGAEHTRDPGYFEIGLIEKEWQALKPTIALGEGGKLKALAREDNVPVYNWDLSKEELAKQLLKKFNAEQIALSQILNPYFGQLRFGKPGSPESFVEGYIKRAKYVQQEDHIKTSADIDRIWKKYFTAGEDWRNIDDYYGLPGFLDEIAIFTNDLRNRQLVLAIKELTAIGEKVFALCGSSHAACIAPALKNK